MHTQILLGFLLALLFGTSTAFVLPTQESAHQDVSNLRSPSKTNSVNTPLLHRSLDGSKLRPRNREEDGWQGPHSAYLANRMKIKARESTETHSQIQKREVHGGALIALGVVLGLGLVIAIGITWRKCQGH